MFLNLGTSDPYLKCVQGNDKLFQTLEKKKTCNPMWAETFVTHVDNPFKPITFQVCNPLFKRTLFLPIFAQNNSEREKFLFAIVI